MTYEELFQLMRLSDGNKTRLELSRVEKSDQVFFEKLTNFFLRCKRKPEPSVKSASTDNTKKCWACGNQNIQLRLDGLYICQHCNCEPFSL